MTSAGANTWSVPLEINNLESQITSGGSVVSSINAGSGISVNASTGAVTVRNTGVISLTPSTGIGISGSNNLTVSNTGVTSLVAGTNITLSGSTGAVTINSTAGSSGVTQIIAGSGVTLSPAGGTGAVTVSAIAVPSSTPIDINGNTNVTISASQLANCYIYSSELIPSITYPATAYTINLPSYSALLSQYGSFAVIQFTIGNLRTSVCQIKFKGDASTQIVTNLVTGSPYLQVVTPIIGTTGYIIQNGIFWRGYCVLDPTTSIALYSFNYINNPLFL